MLVQDITIEKYERVIGVDESGVGELLAQPVVAAVALPTNKRDELARKLKGFKKKDPKRLSQGRRERLLAQFQTADIGRAIFHTVENELFLDWNQYDVFDAYMIKCIEAFQPLSARDLVLIDGEGLEKKRHRDRSAARGLLSQFLADADCDYYNARGLDRTSLSVQLAGLVAQTYRVRIYRAFAQANKLDTPRGTIECGSGNAGDHRTRRWLQEWLKRSQGKEVPPMVKQHFKTFKKAARKAGWRVPRRRKRDDVENLLALVRSGFAARAAAGKK